MASAARTKAKPPLKNTSTRVEASRTVAEIQRLLAQHGARDVTTAFDEDGEPEAISFTVRVGVRLQTFALPARVQNVARLLAAQKQRGLRGRASDDPAAVAWRNLLLWVQAQVALIETAQVEMAEVFLPYLLVDDQRTAYQVYAEQQAALPKPGAAQRQEGE